jgi:DNA-binding FadR family transcriptional regulator
VKRARWPEAAEAVRQLIAGGSLKPGDAAPCGPELAGLTGLPLAACRAALNALAGDGTLYRTEDAARLRVARVPAPEELALSAALVKLRKSHGLTREGLAALLDVPLTAVLEAEAGRTGQGRDFWQRADAMLDGGGGLPRLHDECRAVAAARETGAGG